MVQHDATVGKCVYVHVVLCISSQNEEEGNYNYPSFLFPFILITGPC